MHFYSANIDFIEGVLLLCQPSRRSALLFNELSIFEEGCASAQRDSEKRCTSALRVIYMGGCQTDPRRFLHVVAFPSGGTLFPVVAGLWPAVASCGRVVASCGQLWPAVASCGRVSNGSQPRSV